MAEPPSYDHTAPAQFGGAVPFPATYEASPVVVLPVPFDRTTSYMPGTANGPREILLASSQVELWDEEVGLDASRLGIATLSEVDLSHASLDEAMSSLQRIAGEIMDQRKFLITLGGEHSITPPLVAAAAARHRGLSVLQIDAHADLRDAYMGEPNNHACAMRRTLAYAPLVQVGIRNVSAEEAVEVGSLNTTIFYDWNMRDDANWIDRAVDALSDDVYVTIDLDGLEPGLMPAVGTPEPGGLSWREATTLLKRTFERKRVVACDVVELCPLPGIIAPNFAAARLVYKLISYRAAFCRK
jgi:agmatinase